MDKPVPWICVLVGIAFFEEGVKEARTKNLTLAFVFFGLALLSFIATILTAEARDARELIRVPPLFPYALTALIVSALFGLASEYRRDTRLKTDAQQTAAAIAAFGRQCADRNLPTFTIDQKVEEEHWERDQFRTRFHSLIAYLNREFVTRKISVPEVTDTLLGTNASTILPIIPITAQAIAGLALRLPQPRQWLRKSLFKTAGAYLAVAFVLWFALFGLEHVTRTPLGLSEGPLPTPVPAPPPKTVQITPQAVPVPANPKPLESAYSGLSNATLREITMAHVKSIQALIEHTNDAIRFSQQTYLNPPTPVTMTPEQRREAHEQYINQLFSIEMFNYKQKYLAKSINLAIELRHREPGYVEEMDAEELESLNRKYKDPFVPDDLEKIANDLDTMAQRLPQ